MASYKAKQPEYENLLPGQIIDIAGDQWFVQKAAYYPVGYNVFEGGTVADSVDMLQIVLLRVSAKEETRG